MVDPNRYIAPGETPVIDELGDVKIAPPGKLDAAIAKGYRKASDAETQSWLQGLEYGDSPGAAAFFGAARGASLGLSDYAFTRFAKDKAKEQERLKGLEEQNPVSSEVGEIGSLLVPGSIVGRVGKAAEELGAVRALGRGALKVVDGGRLGSAAGKIVRGTASGAAEGMAMNAGQDISEAALSDRPVDPELTVEHILTSGLLGGALGGLSTAAGEAVGEVSTRMSENIYDKRMVPAVLKKLDEEVKPFDEAPYLGGIKRAEKMVSDASEALAPHEERFLQAQNDLNRATARPDKTVGFGAGPPKINQRVQDEYDNAKIVYDAYKDANDSMNLILETRKNALADARIAHEATEKAKRLAMPMVLEKQKEPYIDWTSRLKDKGLFEREPTVESPYTDDGFSMQTRQSQAQELPEEGFIPVWQRIKKDNPDLAQGYTDAAAAVPWDVGKLIIKPIVWAGLGAVGASKLHIPGVGTAGGVIGGLTGLKGAGTILKGISKRFTDLLDTPPYRVMEKKAYRVLGSGGDAGIQLLQSLAGRAEAGLQNAGRLGTALGAINAPTIITPAAPDETASEAAKRVASDVNSIVSNPDGFNTMLEPMFNEIQKKFGTPVAIQFKQKALDQMKYIQSQIPKPNENRIGLTSGADPWASIPASEINKFLTKVNAAHDPIGTLAQIMVGKGSPSIWKTIKMTHPKLADQVSEQLMMTLTDTTHPLTYDQRQRVQGILGVTVDAASKGNILNKLQAPMMAPASSGAGSGPKRKLDMKFPGSRMDELTKGR